MASTEAKELELVGKVEMKIALAKDDKLEGILKIYLPPLLLKLGSEHLSVRNKVMSTCQHIKVRLSGNQLMVLPVAALLKQYKDNADQSMIRHFDLVFIQQSIGKLPATEQMDLIPVLLHGMSKDAAKSTCSTVFNLFLRLLPRLRLPPKGSKEDSELREKLGLVENSADAEFTAQWFRKLILFTPIKPPPTTPSGASVVRTTPVTCPGLTPEEYDFLSLSGKSGMWDPTVSEGLNLVETKITVLNFLASGAFTDTERFLPALYASADANSRISSRGDDILKRMVVPLEEKTHISSLYDAYFDFKPALQTRILALFSRSAVATTFPSQIIRIVEEGMGVEQGNQTPAKGLESQKFRKAMFIFANWVARIGSKADLSVIAPPLVQTVRGYIENQGWPVPDDRSSDAASLRALAYEALGSMAKTTPSIVVEPSLDIVKWLFRSLTEEGSSDDIFVSIEGTLAGLLSAFARPPDIPPLESEIKENLRKLLLHYMTLEEGDKIVRSARFATVRWANRCLLFDDVVGRWIDILALGGRTDERSDVVEEGKKGLDPYWYRLLNSTSATTYIPFPHLSELIMSFFTGHSLLEESDFANSMVSGMEVDGVSVFGKFSGSKMNAFAPAVSFVRRMMFIQALEGTESALSIDADWERQLDVLFRSDLYSKDAIRSFLEKRVDSTALSTYLTATFDGMLWNEGNGLPDCGECFVEVGSLSPTAVLGQIASRAEDLLASIYSNNVATRHAAARAFGMLAPHPANGKEKLHKLLGPLLDAVKSWRSAIGAEENKVHGAIVAIGYMLSRAVLYGRSAEIEGDALQGFIAEILEILRDTKNATCRDAALVSMGLLCTTGLFSPSQIEKFPAGTDGEDLIGNLTLYAKKSDVKAIGALAGLAMVFEEPADDAAESPLKKILGVLYDLQEIKQSEVHFTIGEALSRAAACWDSRSLVLSLDVTVAFEGKASRPSVLKKMMDKLLKDCKTTKPSLKKASGIWLFSLIQYCGHLGEVQTRLRECQAAFMGLLSARDDLVQETASRGLSLVYEQGDKELRERLVSDLVASFTGTSTKLKVEEDTELFEAGALPTGEGQSVTSYKDIMNLAAEVGDQSLVYKFMSLASNAATWSTRAAFGRFGLSNILSASEVDPKLYPKLYRYRFDPNPNVQRSMTDIWNALVKDSNATIDKYYDSIMEDLLKNILGKEWRTRQASCAAIADLVQGRQFEKYEKYLGQIWEMTFKVIDDIKGSVRKAAMLLSMALTGILVRQLEAGASTTSKNAQTMLRNVLPFLLSAQGLDSSAKEVKIFALDAVLKIVKNGGKTLLPFIPNLVETLLGLLSTMEDESVNYAYFHAESIGLTQDEIDRYRSGAISQSPLLEAVERCMDLLDEATMKNLVPHLENVIKTAIGMPTKMGCSAVLVSLSTRHSFIFKPHADGLLKAVEKAVVDRNPTVSSAYARSTGYLARVASDNAILRLAEYSKGKYFAAEDDTSRQISAEIIYSISKFATDRFNSLASVFLPFVFLAKHDSNEQVKTNFEKTWDENVGGSRAVLLYLNEIVNLSVSRLDSPKWTIKHSSALTIADVVKSCGDETSLANCKIIWPALEKSLALKTFEGKEKILTAFVKFTKSAKALWENDTAVAASMTKIAIREAKRNNITYRPHAFTALGEYAEARTDIDIVNDVYAIISPYVKELIDEDKMDVDSKDNDKEKESQGQIQVQTLDAGIAALTNSIPTHLDRTVMTPHLDTLLPLLRTITANTTITAISTKTVIYTQIKSVFAKIAKKTHSQKEKRYDIPVGYFGLLEIESRVGSEAVRVKRAEAAEALVLGVGAGNWGLWRDGREEVTAGLREGLEAGMKGERSGAVKEILARAVGILEQEHEE